MIKPIMKSEFFLRLPSEDAGPDDAATGQDLLDTLHEHEHECVGLAANMIGVRKRIICVKDGNRALLMYNPQILEQVNAYQTSEGCLSLAGERPCTRYRRIKVEYLDENFVRRIKTSRATPRDHPARNRPLPRNSYIVAPIQEAPCSQATAGSSS